MNNYGANWGMSTSAGSLNKWRKAPVVNYDNPNDAPLRFNSTYGAAPGPTHNSIAAQQKPVSAQDQPHTLVQDGPFGMKPFSTPEDIRLASSTSGAMGGAAAPRFSVFDDVAEVVAPEAPEAPMAPAQQENPWDDWAATYRPTASNNVANLGGQVGSTLNSALLGGYLNAPGQMAQQANDAIAQQMYLNQGASLQLRKLQEQRRARDQEYEYKNALREDLTGILGGFLGGIGGGPGQGQAPQLPQGGTGITAGVIPTNRLNAAVGRMAGGQMKAPETNLPVQGGSTHLNDAFRQYNAGNQVDFSRSSGARNEQMRHAADVLRSQVALAQAGQMQGQYEDDASYRASFANPIIRALLGA